MKEVAIQTKRAKAVLRYLKMTPRKVRFVADLIKGLPVAEAQAQLMAEKRRAAQPLLKLLRSGIANAKNNLRMNVERLYIENIRVDQGPMLKRQLPRARGIATPIEKKMSHVTLVLSEEDVVPPPRFTILVKKKVKLPKEERPKAKREKSETEEKVEIRPKTATPGFFRRIFRRKAGM